MERTDIGSTQPKALDDVLRRQSWLRLALGAASMGAWDYDVATRAITRSPGFDALFGFDPDDQLTLDDLKARYHPDDLERVLTETQRAIVNPEVRGFTGAFRILRPDGSVRWLSAQGEIVRDAEGQPVRTIGVVQDITDYRAALEQKDMLLREISHRVKNNLQTVTSLLSLQAGRVTDPAARQQFDQAIQRVNAVAAMHTALYMSGGSTSDLIDLDFKAYLETLADRLHRILSNDEKRIEIAVEADPVRLPMDVALPLGLCVNELITNAAKYGFPPGGMGRIRIAFQVRPEGGYRLVVADNGYGLEQDFDAETGGLGFQLIRTFARQVRGTITSESRDGLIVTIDLPPLA